MGKKQSKLRTDKPARQEKVARLCRWWQPALVGLLAFACYVQTVRFDFVWDDTEQIVANSRIRSFSNLGLTFQENFWAFYGSQIHGHYYRPLQTLSYMIAYASGGLSPAPYHWVNVILHVLASLACFWFAWELIHDATVALWGGLLFAAHPMHTESVAWSAGITDLGCALFYFAALASWRRSGEDSRPRLWLAASASSFFLALLYKEMALTFPALAIASDFVRDEGSAELTPKMRWGRWFALVIVVGVYAALRIHALGFLMGAPQNIAIGPLDRISTTAYLLGLYLWKMVLPLRHNAYYVFQPVSQLPLTEWVLPILLLLCCGLAAWRCRGNKRLLYLAAFVIVTLAPVLNLGGVGQNVFAERYLYIPSLGFCLLLPAAAERGLRARAGGMATFGGAVLVAIFAGLCLYRNPVWQDNETFYSETVAASPDAAMMHQNLGIVRYQRGDRQAALRQFEAALAAEARSFIRSPRDRYNALIGISTVRLDAGMLEQAWQAASEAQAINPDWEEAYRVLGTVRSRQNRDVEAEELLRRAVALKPADVVARINLGSILLFRKNPLEAESQFRQALEYDSLSAPAHLGAAMTYLQLGRRAEARAQVKEALRIEPGYRDAIIFEQQLEAASPP